MIIPRLCDNCQVEYQAEIKYLNRGQGLFCSPNCASQYRSKTKPIPESNVSCAYCGIDFYLKKSRLKRSKSGLFFCSRSHKDLAQRLGGIKEIMPSHYGTAKIPNYREIAKRHYEQVCRSCGWDKYPDILEVNHIDFDRSNNDPSNLEFLCPTCHQAFHFLTKTGKWRTQL
jgi:hypothetical protein